MNAELGAKAVAALAAEQARASAQQAARTVAAHADQATINAELIAKGVAADDEKRLVAEKIAETIAEEIASAGSETIVNTVAAPPVPPPPSVDQPDPEPQPQPEPFKPEGEFGHIAPMAQQPPAEYDGGRRSTENEHIMPRAQLRDLARDPATKISDYDRRWDPDTGQWQATDANYRNSTTLRVERDMALEKTHGGPTADNRRTEDLRQAVAQGQALDVNEDLLIASIDESNRAADVTGSSVSRADIDRAAVAQLGDLFDIQRLDDTSRRLAELGVAEGTEPDDPHPADDWDTFG